MPNLIEGIQQQANRVRELLPVYDGLGPVGAFGAFMLRRAISEGEAAIASGDVVRMIATYKALEGCKG